MARPVPYALKEKLRAGASETGGKKRLFTKWAKKDGSMKVCWNYKLTVNNCTDIDQYPLRFVHNIGYLARFVHLMPFSRFSWIEIPRSTWPHPQGVVPLQMATLWSLHCTTYFSKNYGSASAGCKAHSVPFRWLPRFRRIPRGTFRNSRGGF